MFPGFYLFDKYISSYVLTSLAGIFTACPLAIYHYKKRGGNDISMIFVFLFGGIGCMFGMHLLYGITNIRQWGSLFSAASFGDWLEAAIRKEEGCADVTIIRSSVGPTIGSHVGPGMVACAFWGKNRADKASLSDRIARRVRGQ